MNADADADSELGVSDGPDWYLREWADLTGKKQSGLVSELDIHKTTAHRLWTGKQPYRRDFVNVISRWLSIEPFELLMPPDQAMALRRLRQTAAIIASEPLLQAAEAGASFDHQAPDRPGRKGRRP